MISTNSSQVLSVKTDRMKLLGIALIQISDGHSNLLFQKGIGISLIQNVVEMHKNSKGGNSVIPINNYLIFTHFFQNQGNTYIIILMDDKENELNYPQMYLLVKKIKKQFPLNCSISDIIKTCDREIEIPRAEGLAAFFILSQNGSCFVSKINNERKTINKMENHISGFISALFTFSNEVIGRESGAKLREINFGNQVFYLITKNDVIFAYLVEKMNPLLERYMYMTPDEFISQYRDQISDFSGDITPFASFVDKITRYFKI